MKILLLSTLFHPSIGGIETVSQILAEEFTTLGHSVTVVTESDDVEEISKYNYQVVRKPSFLKLSHLINQHDLSIHSCISLKYMWLFLLHGKPIFAVHHTWYQNGDGGVKVRDKLKLWLTRFTNNIAVSDAINKQLSSPCQVIENPFRDELFRIVPRISRTKELVFLGRLVSDKGVELLLKALAMLKDGGDTPTLTIIGGGPDLEKLKQTTRRFRLEPQVTFAGTLTSEALRDELNAHKVMVIPSVWQEPFGIVALEGLACGLKIVASDCEGLRQSLAQFGTYFRRGDAESLAEKIKLTLHNSEESELLQNTTALADHLSRHTRRAVADQYIKIISRL